MPTTIELGGVRLDVLRKHIKNVHLSVYPPTGTVRISAPARMSLDAIRLFAISKLGWIRQQQKKLRNQERETEREYLDRESHYVWGKRYLLIASSTASWRTRKQTGRLSMHLRRLSLSCRNALNVAPATRLTVQLASSSRRFSHSKRLCRAAR